MRLEETMDWDRMGARRFTDDFLSRRVVEGDEFRVPGLFHVENFLDCTACIDRYEVGPL